MDRTVGGFMVLLLVKSRAAEAALAGQEDEADTTMRGRQWLTAGRRYLILVRYAARSTCTRWYLSSALMTPATEHPTNQPSLGQLADRFLSGPESRTANLNGRPWPFDRVILPNVSRWFPCSGGVARNTHT
ncbi:hypothetical protein V8C44DRAFT_333340 [Trichoderma aethiopicum]